MNKQANPVSTGDRTYDRHPRHRMFCCLVPCKGNISYTATSDIDVFVKAVSP